MTKTKTETLNEEHKRAIIAARNRYDTNRIRCSTRKHGEKYNEGEVD